MANPAIVLLVAITASLAYAEEPAPNQKTVKVFILAGQSNMQGQGVVSMDHPKLYNGGKGNLVWSMKHSASKDRMKHLKNANGDWATRDDVFVRYRTEREVKTGRLGIGFTGYPGKHHIGLELQFGHLLGNHFDEPVLLIKTAWGGKSLYKDFRPPSAGGETGPYYKKMLAEIDEAIKGRGWDFPQLNKLHPDVVGFVWMQGWNDMVNAEATAEYADNLVHLANDVRRDLNQSKMLFIVGELGNGGPSKEGSGMQEFRNAQKLGTKRIPNALFVETHQAARPKELSPNVGHGHHWFGNAESYFLIGDYLGKGTVKMLAKRHPQSKP